ncbi:MAG: N-formylglutamate amidohydrolase [Acidobacteria bacterium]|nr:N-formylglutamate amidohydrolase [Acidobacteriota bacterium]
MDALPVLLSIPHGGTGVPPELEGRLAIGKKGVFEDIDGFTREIYDLGNKVRRVHKADIARTFVDPGRAPSDLPPENPDGVVKSHTCFGKIIYKENQQPDDSETAQLLEKYYYPFHRRLQQLIAEDRHNLKVCIDCHSMAETGPAISPDTGKERPFFCLGNRFGESATDAMVHKLKSCLAAAFELDEADVAVNNPFAGGYITRHYGNNPLPCIQVEMNRKLYLRAPWFDTERLTISADRTAELNERFYQALKIFFA